MANPKARLNLRCQRDGLSMQECLRFVFTSVPQGWRCDLHVTTFPCATEYWGIGATKKAAEQAACQSIMDELDNPAHPDPFPVAPTPTARAASPEPQHPERGPMTMTSYMGRKKVERMSVKGYDLVELYDWLGGIGPDGLARMSATDPRTGNGSCNYQLCYNIPASHHTP